jgi:AraC-like DNA-binding protein
MKPIPLIRASGALAFANFLADAGAPAERLWAESGLPPGALDEPERLIPLHLVNRFGEHAAADQVVPDLGVRVAQRFGLESAGRFGTAIRRAPTLQRAIETTCNQVVTHNSGARFWLAHEGESVRLCRRFRNQDPEFRQSDLLVLALMISAVRVAAGPAWRPARVEMQSAGPHELYDCDLFGDAHVMVGRPVTSITFSRALLRRPFRASGAPPARTIADGPGLGSCPSDFLLSLEVVIGTLLESGSADVATAAKVAGSSVRSFQRRLTELDVSYSGLVDKVRFRTARELLQDADVKILSIALGLGYSDAAHFTRAFRRWTSLTPMEYRHLHLDGAEGLRHSA